MASFEPAVNSPSGRRGFLARCGAAVAGAAATGMGEPLLADTPPPTPDPCDLPESIRALAPLPGQALPIAPGERSARRERALRLMAAEGLDAVLLEPGSSLAYFLGVSWGLSERPFLAVLAAKGEAAFVCPAFEEARARERVGAASDVRTWQEDESPYARVAQILRERGLGSARIGVEERLRFFVYDGVRQELPSATFASATPVSTGCRSVKSPAELALMQRANDITIAAFRAAFATLREGMTQHDLERNALTAMARLGGDDPGGLVGFGAASAFPHGSVALQRLREGDVVLLDMGCAVEGYQSDVTRTTVFGRPTSRQTEIWNLERRAQDAAFEAARLDATCESVDAAARRVIAAAGLGPDYRVPGLPHRTGHGIGLDGHEAPNFVRGDRTRLRPGMCFSNEPTIAIYGEFGIRLEDCLYLAEDGPRFFTPQSEAIDRPLPEAPSQPPH
jgi:Xaa-Pro aminopeptidase